MPPKKDKKLKKQVTTAGSAPKPRPTANREAAFAAMSQLMREEKRETQLEKELENQKPANGKRASRIKAEEDKPWIGAANTGRYERQKPGDNKEEIDLAAFDNENPQVDDGRDAVTNMDSHLDAEAGADADASSNDEDEDDHVENDEDFNLPRQINSRSVSKAKQARLRARLEQAQPQGVEIKPVINSAQRERSTYGPVTVDPEDSTDDEGALEPILPPPDSTKKPESTSAPRGDGKSDEDVPLAALHSKEPKKLAALADEGQSGEDSGEGSEEDSNDGKHAGHVSQLQRSKTPPIASDEDSNDNERLDEIWEALTAPVQPLVVPSDEEGTDDSDEEFTDDSDEVTDDSDEEVTDSNQTLPPAPERSRKRKLPIVNSDDEEPVTPVAPKKPKLTVVHPNDEEVSLTARRAATVPSTTASGPGRPKARAVKPSGNDKDKNPVTTSNPKNVKAKDDADSRPSATAAKLQQVVDGPKAEKKDKKSKENKAEKKDKKSRASKTGGANIASEVRVKTEQPEDDNVAQGGRGTDSDSEVEVIEPEVYHQAVQEQAVDALRAREEDFPATIRFAYDDKGNVLGVTKQVPVVKEVWRFAMNKLLPRSLFLRDVYPETTDQGAVISASCLLDACDKKGQPELKARLLDPKDRMSAKALALGVYTRRSHTRTDVLKIVRAVIARLYGFDSYLHGNSQLLTLIISVLREEKNYIFEGSLVVQGTKVTYKTGSGAKKMPFMHEAFSRILAMAFFAPGGKYTGMLQEDDFPVTKSKHPDYVGKREVPEKLLAFIGTCIDAALHEYMGGYHKAEEFSEERATVVYRTHLATLTQHSSRGAKHITLCLVYEDALACASTASVVPVKIAKSSDKDLEDFLADRRKKQGGKKRSEKQGGK